MAEAVIRALTPWVTMALGMAVIAAPPLLGGLLQYRAGRFQPPVLRWLLSLPQPLFWGGVLVVAAYQDRVKTSWDFTWVLVGFLAGFTLVGIALGGALAWLRRKRPGGPPAQPAPGTEGEGPHE